MPVVYFLFYAANSVDLLTPHKRNPSLLPSLKNITEEKGKKIADLICCLPPHYPSLYFGLQSVKLLIDIDSVHQ